MVDLVLLPNFEMKKWKTKKLWASEPRSKFSGYGELPLVFRSDSELLYNLVGHERHRGACVKEGSGLNRTIVTRILERDIGCHETSIIRTF